MRLFAYMLIKIKDSSYLLMLYFISSMISAQLLPSIAAKMGKSIHFRITYKLRLGVS
jgi:hypothetical protein